MNRTLINNIIGKILILSGAFMILPIVVAIVYYDADGGSFKYIFSFIIPIVISIVFGILLNIKRAKNKSITIKEGFLIVVLSWLVMSLVGAIPLIISGDFVYSSNPTFKDYVNAFFDSFFEVASGFTTTGASVCRDVEALSHSIQFWRSFTHWIGGMGILVFILTIIPESKDGSAVHILRAESPGPTVDKLVSRTRVTTRILYIIYIVLSLSMVLFLWLGPDNKMTLFNSLIYTFGCAGTGGFGIDNPVVLETGEVIVGLNLYSKYVQYVIAIYMTLFSLNFTIFYFLLIGKVKEIVKNEEIRWFFGIYIGALGLLMLSLIKVYTNFEELFRFSLFTTATIMSTTGYGNVDFTSWPLISRCIIIILTIIGGCAGSTAGGIKVSRLVIFIKSLLHRIRQTINPRKVKTINVDGKPISDEVVTFVHTYMIFHMVIVVACAVLISVDWFYNNDLTLADTFSASLTCISNVGPGVTKLIGPAGGFSGFSNFSKFILSLEMIAGRLELIPLIVFIAPTTWIKKF